MNIFYLIIKQIVIIAYTTGFLWLKRNPLSLFFSAISPFSLLFVLFIISNGKYTEFAIAGSLIMALVGYGLSLGQDISLYKTEYKIQDVFVASPVSPLTYMTGLAISQLLFGFPALSVLVALTLLYIHDFIDIIMLFVTILIVWGSASSLGFFLSSHMMHMRNATQIISFINIFLTILPPVFYPVNIIPEPLQALAYIVPTTHASILIQDIMHQPVPSNWFPELGFLVEFLYLVGFVMLAKTRSMWREP
ncbi:MAG: hypothetical protein DA328_04070 [Nitrososphaeraceae archaeon]|nr:hypothetical protein [Nitrososphaeraceae archaeon]